MQEQFEAEFSSTDMLLRTGNGLENPVKSQFLDEGGGREAVEYINKEADHRTMM